MSKKDFQNLLILDLDHCLFFAAYHEIPGLELKGRYQIFYFYHRPGLKEFLDHVSNKYDLIFYTSSRKRYAYRVVLSFKLEKEYPVYSRSYCIKDETEYGERYWKSLRLIGFENMEGVKVLDDRPEMWDDAGIEMIEIKPWHGESFDRELFDLIEKGI